MNVLLLLIPLSLVLLVVMIAAFAWAVRSGQFDDLDTPPLDILADKQEEEARGDDADER
jgi:cbb3-type cytochrome oxidase maturation protein